MYVGALSSRAVAKREARLLRHTMVILEFLVKDLWLISMSSQVKERNGRVARAHENACASRLSTYKTSGHGGWITMAPCSRTGLVPRVHERRLTTALAL